MVVKVVTMLACDAIFRWPLDAGCVNCGNSSEISQEELAARAGLHRNYVGSVERGERDIGITAIGRLAGALGVSLAEFFASLGPRSKRE